jgi:UbiD family decarboxylase
MVKWSGLRGWLSEVEKLGELKVIGEQVDWNEEAAAITYLVGKSPGSPALLFDHMKETSPGFRLLTNILGSSLNRVALTLGLPKPSSVLELIGQAKDVFKGSIPPVLVDKSSAPVNENLLSGDQVDLGRFPALRMWPFDGGRYIGTADIVITRDLDDGHLNVGTYRQMVISKDQVGFYVSPGKDAFLQREKYWKKGKPCEVACVYGVDPLLLMCGAMSFPKNVSEYDVAGGVAGRGIEVVKGEVTDLLIPASAEIVIEGVAYPEKTSEEGPFGEFTGYYGRPGGPTPMIDVKCVHYRNDPILTASLMADHPSNELGLFYTVTKSARVWDDLESLGIPGIRGVYAPTAAAGGFGMTVVSMEQKYPGHASQVAALAAQSPGGAYYTKWIVVVDEDVDPTNMEQVLWAMSTRCDPERHIDILRDTWSTYLDPTKNPPEERLYGSKALINACKEYKYLKTFSKRTLLRKSTYDLVKEKWSAYGVTGEIPHIGIFDNEAE